MRPQRNAGENEYSLNIHFQDNEGFNEAPAKCRGKPALNVHPPEAYRSFNEAPAKCRGKRKSR